MSDIGELEQRLADAMDRIRTGVEALSAPPAVEMVPAQDFDELESQLADAARELAETSGVLNGVRARNGELEDALAEAQDAVPVVPEPVPGLADDDREALEAEIRTLRASVEALQAANAELRRSALTGVTDPELINRSLVADLEAVQSARLAELRDIDSILRSLDAQ